MKIVETPGIQPGCCYLCRTAKNHRGFFYIDTNRDSFDGFDRIFICKNCLKEIAAVAGLVPENVINEHKKKNHALKKKLEETEKKMNQYRAVVMAMKEALEEDGGGVVDSG